MTHLTRRSFFAQSAASLGALGLIGGATDSVHAQLVWKGKEWKLAAFNKLAAAPARVKQVYDIAQIGEGKFLNNIKNSLNGLEFGFDVPKGEIKIVAALHGPANMMNFDDSMWGKYRIGEWLHVTDPTTGKPAERNIFYAARGPLGHSAFTKDPDDLESVYQDTSMEALQARGVKFLSCHTAAEEQARILVKHFGLKQEPEEIVKDLLAHAKPHVLVVASMVAAIALLQAEGHYTYITV
jgi:hypothetical protein